MLVDYCSVQGCKFRIYCEKPCIFAPEGTGEFQLQKYHFELSPEGEYYKFLTDEEYAVIQRNPSANLVKINLFYEDSSPAEQKSSMQNSTANWICIGSVLAFLIGIVPLLIPLYSEPGLIILITPPLMWVTALILAVLVRVRCPESLFGKILLIMYIILILLAVIAILLFMAACSGAWDACFNCECIGSGMG